MNNHIKKHKGLSILLEAFKKVPEFNHVSAIKQSLDGKQESILFFCEPYHSSEKPRVEKNHTLT